jgi:hypothetical protein
MSFTYRIFMGFILTIAVLATSAATARSANDVAQITNLRLVSGDANQVKLAWDAPAHGSTNSATIDEYIIKRDHHQIADLQGFNGMVDPSYIDSSPSAKKAVYTVIAYDSTGQRSPPAKVDVPAPQTASQTPDAKHKEAADNIVSSDLCDSIIPPDLMGHNLPTGLEKYGCGEGMNHVNDSEADTVGIGPLKTNKPRIMHDIFQGLFIQLPNTVGQAAFLAVSAFHAIVLQASTYAGVGKLFGGILQAFHGNPNYPGLVSFAIALSLFFLTLMVIRGERRKGLASFGMIVTAIVVLTVLLANPFRTMNYAVNKPLGVFGSITSEMTDMVTDTPVANQFNLSVTPTYGGNKIYSSIRRAEYVDWLMFQYLPQCAINFRDYHWTFSHDYPGTHTSWCERYVQVWSDGSDDDKDAFKDKLKDVNPKVYDFFNSGNQTLRVIDSVVSKLVLTVHLVMELARDMGIFGCMILLLGEILFSVLWLIYAATGSDGARLMAERRMRTMFHWLAIPGAMLLIALVQEAVEANIIRYTASFGFIGMLLIELIWDILMMCVCFSVFKSMRRNHKEAMERLGAYRNERGLLGKAVQLGATAFGAGAGAEVVREHMEKKKEKKASSGEEVPADETFDFTGFSTSQPLLEAGSKGGNSGQDHYGPSPSGSPSGDEEGDDNYWDADADAVEIPHELPVLERVAGSSRENPEATQYDPDVDVDVDVDVDAEPDVIVDADVVIDAEGSHRIDNSADTDFGTNGHQPLSDDWDFQPDND